MKIPKKTRRFCPHCNKHTEHKIALAKQGGRNAAHPQSRYGASRVKRRGENVGIGNQGRYSKPAIKSWKRKTKATKKSVLVYTCQVCKKAHITKKGIRSSKLQVEEKDVNKKANKEAAMLGGKK